MDVVAQARELYQGGQYGEAEKIARHALLTDENNAPLLLLLGDLRSRAGDWLEAIALFERCMPLHKHLDRVRKRLLEPLLKSDRWMEARELWLSAESSEREFLKKPIGNCRSKLINAEAEFAEFTRDVLQPRWLAWWLFYEVAVPVQKCEKTLLRLFQRAEENGSVSRLLSAMAEAEVLPVHLRDHLQEGVRLWLRQPLARITDLRLFVDWIRDDAAAAASSPILGLLSRMLLERVLPALRQFTSGHEVEWAVDSLLGFQRIFPENARVALALGDGFMRLGRARDAASSYEKALEIGGNPERVRLRLLTACVQLGNWKEALKWRECMETRWGAFRAALACYEFVPALALGRRMVRENEPVSDDWVPAYLGLLFELNLMGDALAVLGKPGLSDAMTERYRFWLAWEGVGSRKPSQDRMEPFRKSADEGIQWCVQALDLLDSADVGPRQLTSHLSKPRELASPLSAIGIELSARLESVLFRDCSTSRWRSLTVRQWELMPCFIRSRTSGKSFSFRVHQ